MKVDEEKNARDVYASLILGPPRQWPNSHLCMGCIVKSRLHIKRHENPDGWQIWEHDGYVWCQECLLEELRNK